MSGIEESLLQTLEKHPEDWSVRMLVVDKMLEREARDEAAELICAAPCAPKTEEQVFRMAELGEGNSLELVQEFVKENPASAYGHQVLAGLLQFVGREEQAGQHLSVASALGGGAGVVHEELEQPQQQLAESYEHEVVEESVVTHNEPDQYYPHAEASENEDHFVPPPPDNIQYEQSNEGNPKKQTGSKATAIIIAVGVHVLIALIAALVVILPPAKDEPEIVAAVIGPPKKKQEMQKKNVVKQTKKSSASAAAAAPIAQLMRANAVAKIAMPNVTRTSTGPLGIGEADFGGGGFGSGGDGLGSGASFFGGTSTGKRFLFIIDHSGSMKPNQVQLRNDELQRALSSLKGVQYQVLLFAGGGYYAWKGWSLKADKGHKVNTVTGPKKTTHKFLMVKGFGDYKFDGADSKLPREEWLNASSANVKETMKHVKANKLFGGTDWELALRIGHLMKPAPDVIFFMSDGTGGNNPPPILAMNSKHGKPVINTVAMQTTQGMDQFAEIAKKTKGSFTIVDKKGKPIDGFDFKKNPGKYKGRL